MSLSVIGVGLPRTGTSSLKLALNQLGFGPCCQTTEPSAFGRTGMFWMRVFSEEAIDWDEIFRGYRSAVDFPSGIFFKELSGKYPNSKLILTVRDSSSWFDSFERTVLPWVLSFKDSPYWEITSKIYTTIFCENFWDRNSMIAAYDRHNANVVKLIPGERLLVYKVADGWLPLCKFLNVPEPGTKFPFFNTRTEFPAVVREVMTRAIED